MKKKVYLTLLSIFIIVITASSSYAYFNNKLDIKGSNGNNLNVLNIQNGNEKINNYCLCVSKLNNLSVFFFYAKIVLWGIVKH